MFYFSFFKDKIFIYCVLQDLLYNDYYNIKINIQKINYKI